MSAAAPREAAGTGAVARHYLRLLGRERGVATLLLPISLLLLGSLNATGFAGLGKVLSLAFLFPLYQWRGGGRDPLDRAMPMDSARHRRIRVACGAAWVALGLTACVGLYTALFSLGDHALDGFPAWYPPALVGWGLAGYLFGSAAWLRAERPGRTLTLLYLIGGTAMEWLPGPWPGAVLGLAEPAQFRATPWPVWAAACLLTLALACAAVWVAALPGRLLPRLRLTLSPWLRARGEVPANRPAASFPAGPRRAASFARVLRWELSSVSHDARWALLLAVPVAMQAMGPEIESSLPAVARLPLAGRAGTLLVFPLVAFFWPLLVWMDARGAGREWAEAVPTGTVRRRLLRLLAGAAWLELVGLVVGAGVVAGAWRAGVIASPASVPVAIWAGFPLGVLMMYLLGSVPLLLSPNHPVRYTVVWYLFFLMFAQPLMFAKEWRFSPGAALSVLALSPPRHWGEAMLVWLPLIAAVAVGAVAAGVAHDRDGGSFPRPAR
jgi:hypothetical protein